MSREELETVKAVIRALLIAENRPMSLRSFLCAFKNTEGHEVPYRNFGFSDALNFLRSIPDAVQLAQIGSDFSVKAAVTEEVKHVERLVRCQRESNYLSRRSTPSSRRATSFQAAQSTLYSPPRQRSLLAPSYNDALEQVRANLRLLLADYLTNGISVRLLQESYTRRFGSLVNYRDFGYSTFEDFVVGMSDIMWPVRSSTGVMKVHLRRSVHHTTVRRFLPGQELPKPMYEVIRTAHNVGAPSYVMPPKKPVAHFTVHRTTGMHSLPGQRIQEPVQQVTRTDHRVGPPSFAVPSGKPPENFTVRHTTENHSRPCQEVREPLQLVKTAHSGLHLQESVSAIQSLHSDMQSTGMKPQQEPHERSPAVQSLHQDIQRTATVPKMWESNQSRSSSFHLDIQPAGMEPLIPESCPAEPTESSVHPDTKPGVEKAAMQTLGQGGLSSLPKGSLEDYKEPGTDTETLIEQEITTRSSTERNRSSCGVNPCLEKNIKMILRQHPEGVWLSQFANIYKAMIGVDLSLADHGHNSWLSLMHSYRHVVSLTRPFPDLDFMVCLHENLRDSPLDHRTLDTMYTLIRLNGQQGLTVEELLQSFKKITGNSIDLEEHGLSHQAFVLILAAEFDMMFETLRNGQILMKCQELQWGRANATSSVETAGTAKESEAAIATEAASENQTAQVTELASLPSTLREMSGIEALRNSDIAEYIELAESTSEADEFEQIIILALTSSFPTAGIRSPPLFIRNNPYRRPDHLEVGKYHVVYVSEIYSVHHFYIQKRGMDASVRLEALMSQLNTMYNGPKSSAYIIQKKLVFLGMPCAAFYTYNEGSSDWYRALVVALDADPNTCQVLLVDYGTLAFVKKTELRFLRNEFMELPPQAVRATMEYLKPVNSDSWTPDTKAAFVRLASNDQIFMCEVLRRRGAVHSVSLCVTSPHSEAYVSDLLVEQRLALPTLQYKEIMAKILEARSISTVQQEDVPSPLPSARSGGGTASIPTPMLLSQKVMSQVMEAGPSTAQQGNSAYATPSMNVQTTLGRQPAYPILRSQDCQPIDQAEPCSQNIPSASETTELAQSLDKLCSDAPTTDHAQQMQAVSFTRSVQLTSLPHAHDVGTPTPQYPKEIPHEFVTPHQLNETYCASLFDACEGQRISLPKKLQKLVKEEQRSSGLCASSAVQPCAASTAQTIVQSTLQTSLHSSGEQASKPLHCQEQTVAASAVQHCSPPGREAAVQPTVSSAAQPQFSIQLTSKPAKVFPVIPRTWRVKPKMAESTTNGQNSQSGGKPAVHPIASSAPQPQFQASVQRTTKPAMVFPVVPHTQSQKLKMAESTTNRRYSQSGGEPAVHPTVSSALQPQFQASAQRTTKPATVFPVMPRAQTRKPELPESTTIQRYSQSGEEPAVSSALQPQFQASVQLASKPAKDFPVIPPPPIEKPQMTESATSQPACGAVDDDKDILDILQQELDGPCPGRAVKVERLVSGFCLMVVNYEGQPYVTTANVCQLLGWSADIVLQRLKAKRIHFPTLVLERNRNNYWLFNQMESFSVPGVKTCDHLVRQVTFFPLKNVTDILNLFGCTTLELKHDIAAVLHAFDPKSPYWHSVSDDATSHENLEQVVMELCNERAKLRAEILSSQVTSETVDRLTHIECTIERLKKVILAEDAKQPPCEELSKIRSYQ